MNQDLILMGEISWVVHRAREKPIKTVIVALVMLLFIILTFFSLGAGLAVVALLVLGVATHSYFLPVYYRLDEQGVTVDKRIFKYRYEWQRFRRFFLTENGVVLSPFDRPSFLDNFRGVHLLLPIDRTAIVNYLKGRLGGCG
ncbi:MAG: hypothetical protein ACUVUR_04155 [bacterium]